MLIFVGVCSCQSLCGGEQQTPKQHRIVIHVNWRDCGGHIQFIHTVENKVDFFVYFWRLPPYPITLTPETAVGFLFYMF